MFYESTLEREFNYIALTDRRIVSVEEQVGPFHYVNAAGKPAYTTFDNRLTTVGGVRIAVAVKPEEKVASSGVLTVLALARAQDRSHRFANAFELRTGAFITRDRSADARLIYARRRMRNADDVAAMRAFVARLRGELTFSALLRAAGCDDARGFTAVINLIDENVLERAGLGRITLDLRLRPSRNPNR